MVICTVFYFSKGNAMRVESFGEKECKDISDITNMKIINIIYIYSSITFFNAI